MSATGSRGGIDRGGLDLGGLDRGGLDRGGIAMVSGFYPPHLGGVERVAQSLARALAARGHRVRVLAGDLGARHLPGASIEDGVPVHRLRAVEVAHTPIVPGIPARLAVLGRSWLPHVQVAQAFLPEAVWAARLAGRRPYVVHFHLDPDPTGRFGRLLPLYKRSVFGVAMRGARAVIVLSADQADFVERTHGVRRDRVHVVANGIGQEFFDLAASREPRRAPGPTRVLFVGRLSAQKNLDRLLGALSLVRAPVQLTVVGDGEQRDRLHRRVEAERLPVRFTGVLDGAALHEQLLAADVFVLPSDKEGMPLAVLEAMATGLPVLATDVEGTRDLVCEAGVLVEPTERALAAGIERMCEDATLRDRMAQAGMRRAQNFTWDGAASRLEQVYRAVRGVG